MKTFKNGIKIYDETLPRHTIKGRECIWWEQTQGKLLAVEYCGIIRYVEFLKYEKRNITYKVIETGQQFVSAINSFICRGNILRNVFPDCLTINFNWKYKVGDIVKGRLHDIRIIDCEIRSNKKINKGTLVNNNEKWYRGECQDCGYDEIWFREDRPNKWIGCPCCNGHVLVVGKNDLATTNPEVLNVLTNPQEAYKHTRGEHIWLNTTYPLCGFQKDVYIINLALGKYVCNNCSDGISYPEKFLINMLDQLKVDYIYQFSRTQIEWCGKYKYDFWLRNNNTIVEINGLQHYQDNNISKKKDVQENDRLKYNLAIDNGINEYIVIDARYSNKDYIRTSIEQSKLAQMFDLSKVNWDICELNACKSYVVYTCDRWNEGISVQQIAHELRLSPTCIRTYLRKLQHTNLVNDYTSGESRRRSLKYRKEKNNAAG